ncbi:MAG: MaoC family dehydratase N-terminal domain-containing protein [Thermodesulfobacteriota bacterium]
MARNFQLTPEMLALVGWKSQPWRFEVTTTGVRAFARGVGYQDPVYYQAAEAVAKGYRDLPAPPTYLGLPMFVPGLSDDLLPIAPGFAAPLQHGLQGLLDGGTEIEYFHDICAGDVLTGVRELKSLECKESQALGTMLVVTLETVFTNQDGRVVARDRVQALYY